MKIYQLFVLFIMSLASSPFTFASSQASDWAEHVWYFLLFDLAFMLFMFVCFQLFKQLAKFPRTYRYKPLK